MKLLGRSGKTKSVWSNVVILLAVTATAMACVFLSSAFDNIENKRSADSIYQINQQRSIIEHVAVLANFFTPENQKKIKTRFSNETIAIDDFDSNGDNDKRFDLNHARNELRDLAQHLDFLDKSLDENMAFLPDSINKLYFGIQDVDLIDESEFGAVEKPANSVHYKVRDYIIAANKLSQLSQDDDRRIVSNVNFIKNTSRDLSVALDNSVTLYYQYLVHIVQEQTHNHWLYVFFILFCFTVGLVFFVIKPVQLSLDKAYEEAALANRIKTEFLTSVSHEIRTPMHGIISAGENLSSTKMDDKQASYVQTVLSSAESLLDVVNDILGYSSLESGDTVVEVSRFNLYELIGDLVQIMEERAQSKDLELILRYEDGVPHEVGGDSSLVRQVFYHLISNAIKFTETGYIVVTVDSNTPIEGFDFSLKFSIEDTGIGISESNLSLIFEQFVQGNGGTTRIFSGTGLGLSICKKLVALMGGSLRVGSVLGEGSTFSFVLPLNHADNTHRAEIATSINFTGSILFICDDANFKTTVLAELGMSGMQVVCIKSLDFMERDLDASSISLIAVDYFVKSGSPTKLCQHAKANEDLVSTPIVCISRKYDKASTKTLMEHGFLGVFTFPNDSELFAEFISSTSVNSTRTQQSVNSLHASSGGITAQGSVNYLEGASILLVEDNRINATLAQDMLEDLGALVTHAENGKIAVEFIKSGTQFDLVLMDCMMPVMDGFRATEEIRDLPQTVGKTLPIVALTANAMVGDKERCLDAGMNAYLSKPVRKKDLQTMLGKWLQHRKLAIKAAPQHHTLSAHPPAEGATEALDKPKGGHKADLHNAEITSVKPVTELTQDDEVNKQTPTIEANNLDDFDDDFGDEELSLANASSKDTPAQLTDDLAKNVQNNNEAPKLVEQKAIGSNNNNAKTTVQATPENDKDKTSGLNGNKNSSNKTSNKKIQFKATLQPASDAKPSTSVSQSVSEEAYELQFLDKDIIAKARKMMKRRFPTMIEYFLEDTQNYIDQIRKGLSQSDYSQLVVPSHTVKSSARQMGAITVSDLGKEIETLARAEETPFDDLCDLTDQLQEQFDLSRIDFNNLLSEGV